MHQSIEKKLNKAFGVLNTRLVVAGHEDWLIKFLDLIVIVEKGLVPYISAIESLQKAIPEMKQEDIKDATSDIINLLYGRDPLIRQYEDGVSIHDAVIVKIVGEYSDYVVQEAGVLKII